MIGVGAWLVGAGAATGGSLLAVSLIGQGMAGFASQPMAAAAVARAARTDYDDLASATASASPRRTTATSGAAPHGTPRASARPTVTQGESPSPQPPATAGSGAGTVLTSQGGDVVAGCQAAGAYLISWSPQQGYETGDVQRGPAAQASVTFESAANSVVMQVTCQNGEPQASSYVQSGSRSTDE